MSKFKKLQGSPSQFCQNGTLGEDPTTNTSYIWADKGREPYVSDLDMYSQSLALEAQMMGLGKEDGPG